MERLHSRICLKVGGEVRAGRNEKKTFPEQPVSRIPALSATLAAEKAGAILYAKAVAAKVQGKELWLVSDSSTRALSVAEGALLRSWRFTHPPHTRSHARRSKGAGFAGCDYGGQGA